MNTKLVLIADVQRLVSMFHPELGLSSCPTTANLLWHVHTTEKGCLCRTPLFHKQHTCRQPLQPRSPIVGSTSPQVNYLAPERNAPAYPEVGPEDKEIAALQRAQVAHRSPIPLLPPSPSPSRTPDGQSAAFRRVVVFPIRNFGLASIRPPSP